MRKLLFLSLLLPAVGFADQSLHGYCAQTATLVLQSGGLVSSPQAMGVYPGCTVNVYYTGTTTPAPIYSDNGITPLANPFTANGATGAFQFYAANGRYDVNLSGGTPTPLPSAFTLSDYLLFDLPGTLTSAGCLYSPGTSPPTGPAIFPGCVPTGPNGAVQTNSSGSFLGTGGLTFLSQVLAITGTSQTAMALTVTGSVTATGGYASTLNGINSFTGTSDGANLQALRVGQNSAVNAGGYIHLTPITYNPYNQSGVCKDPYGNPVQQPLNLSGDGTTNVDVYIWLTTSPLMPTSATALCPTPGGPALPVSPLVTVDGVPNQQWGVASNGYAFFRGGYATDNADYNSFQSFFGGMYAALGFTTPIGFNMGPNSTCAGIPAVGGGYGAIAFQGGNTYCEWNVSMGAWLPWIPGSGGGGTGCTISATANEIVYVNGGGMGCATSATLTFNPSTNVLSVTGAVTGSTAYVLANGGFVVPASGSGGSTAENAIQCLSCGGLFGLGVSAQALFPSAVTGTPGFIPAMGYGGVVYQGTGLDYWFYNATTPTWSEVNLGAFGSGCTVTGATGNIVYLASSSTCGNSANFTYSGGQVTLTGTGGSFETVGVNNGFDASTCTNAFCLQAPSGGGLFGLGVTAEAFFPTANPSPSFSPGAGNGGITYAGSGVGSGAVYKIWNGAGTPAWINFDFAVGGGTGCTLGSAAASSILYVTTGPACAGSANFTYASSQVTLTGGNFETTGQYGFVASTCGMSSFLYNCIQAPYGGVLALAGTLGGVNGRNPITLALVGTSGSGTSRSSLAWDSGGGSPTALWQAVTDLTLTGDQGWGLYTTGANVYAITANYATGNVGIGTYALTGTGQNLYVLGASNVSGITLGNGFITAPGLILNGGTTNALQNNGGYDCTSTSVNCLIQNSNVIIDNNRDAFFVNLTVTGTCTGCGGGTNYWQLSGSTLEPINTSYSIYAPTGVISSGSYISAVSGFEISSTVVINGSGNFVGAEVIPSAAGTSTAFSNASATFTVTGNGGVTAKTVLVSTGGSFILASGITVLSGGNTAVTCSGTPTSSFAVTNGIVTHC